MVYVAPFLVTVGSLLIGLVNGIIVKNNIVWYQSLSHPWFTPPDWIFGPVWTTLYILIGITCGSIISTHENKKVIHLFAMQYLLNFIWTPLFFGLHAILAALIDLFLLLCLVVKLILEIPKSPLYTTTFTFYFLWLSFALILNTAFYFLN